jgi:hypothetical protein
MIPAGQGAVVDTCTTTTYDSRLSWGYSCDTCNSTVDDFCGNDASITIPVQSQTTTVYVLVSGYRVTSLGPFVLTTRCSGACSS